jgi:MFS transporter, ACS family, hexuronate transporter
LQVKENETMTSTNPSDVNAPSLAAGASRSPANFRWVICGLLFVATTTNYIDRAVISLLKPILARPDVLNWSEKDYSVIVMVFQAAYAIGLLLAGGIIDRIGVRKGLLLAVIVWTGASCCHGLVAYMPKGAEVTVLGQVLGITALSVIAFSVCRAVLGIAEAANFPASIRAVSEWFPRKERALATGIFNCGANIGALTAPYLVPRIYEHWGWPAAFLITGLLAVLWIFPWLTLYQSPEKSSRLSRAEYAYIKGDADEKGASADKLPWLTLIGKKQTWAFSIVKFLTDPIWWFYLFWVPSFLNERYKVKVTDVGLPLIFIYGMTTVGSIGGGWLSSTLIKRGWSVNRARKVAMLACALCVVPAFTIPIVENLWVSVFLIALAASAHQGFSANIFTIVSDTVPQQGIGSVTGIGGMFGSVGSILFSGSVGYILDATGKNYFIPFSIASCAYLIAVLILHLILPRLEPMRLSTIRDPSTGDRV